jgi:hypothetical protein
MQNTATELLANANDRFWPGWGPCRESGKLGFSRHLPSPGNEVDLSLELEPHKSCFVACIFASPVSPTLLKGLSLKAGASQLPLKCQSGVPYIAYTFIKSARRQGRSIGVRLLVGKSVGEERNKTEVLSIAVLPGLGMKSRLWLSRASAFARLLPGNAKVRAVHDFPYSHFDGTEYLEKNPDVKDAMLSRRCPSALYHFLKFGRREGRRITLATHSTPNPGSLLNLANRLREQSHAHWTEGRAVSQENDLLLLQLHQVQEELEEYFLANRKLQESQQKLAALESEHSELVNRHSSLVTAFKELESKHSSLVTAFKELESKHSSLVTAFKELESKHSSLVAERDATAKERDALKKTASERAIRIAELEAQVADQAERQRQIDEEMAKADGQLEMLKDLLRPALP